jgi:dsRNA-specific ribonuclease
VLGLAISSELFPRFPNAGAGRLTKLRAQAVARGACADVARDLSLPDRLRAQAGEGGRSAEELVRTTAASSPSPGSTGRKSAAAQGKARSQRSSPLPLLH